MLNQENESEIILQLKDQKEKADRMLLNVEYVILLLALVSIFGVVFMGIFVETAEPFGIVYIVAGIIAFIIGVFYSIKIEQVAGYYECQKCHNKYVPSFSSVLGSVHIGRTRYMKCPKCNMRSWQKKVISK